MMTNIKRNYSLPLRFVSLLFLLQMIIFYLAFFAEMAEFFVKNQNDSNIYFSPINRKNTSKICWTTFTDGIGKFEKAKNVEL